jgi:hypothetical protein
MIKSEKWRVDSGWTEENGELRNKNYELRIDKHTP